VQAAQEAVQARDTFFSVASHELKNPLTALLGNAQLLQRRLHQEVALSDRNQRMLGVIVEQAGRLNKLIAEMLDVGRIASGHLALTRGAVDLVALAERVVAEVQPTLTDHTLAFERLAPSLVVDGDAVRLEQVLQNLLQNAIKYSPEGGSVAVRVERQGHLACLAVTDQGIGIAPEDLPRLFQRFYRAEHESAGGIAGLGIGLYVVKEIVSLHDGTIDVQSALGGGSTFTVRLPLAARVG
jgi:signal transduction histidine kinase